jgi:transcriptional regulator NrdR family protein
MLWWSAPADPGRISRALPVLRVRRGPRGRLPSVRGRGDDPPSARLRGLWSTLHHLRAGRGGPLLVLKRDGSREQFELGKLISGLAEGLQEPAISHDEILRIASDIEEAVRARASREVESQEVGIELLNALRELDPVAYMRFASVYKDFQDPRTSSASWRTSAPSARPPRQAAVEHRDVDLCRPGAWPGAGSMTGEGGRGARRPALALRDGDGQLLPAWSPPRTSLARSAVDHGTRVLSGRHPAGDRPEGVPGLDHVGDPRRRPVGPDAAGQPGATRRNTATTSTMASVRARPAATA